MKSITIILLSLITIITVNAQANMFNEAYRFNKFMDKVKDPKGNQLTYADIEGNAYYSKGFASAKIENATSLLKVRYNIYTDTVELLNEEDIFELPKSTKYSPISFLNPAATLVLYNIENLPQGYYFESTPGNFILLKKMKVEFREGAKAVNSFTPAIPPKFENLKPEFYLKTKFGVFLIPKKAIDFLEALPEKKSEAGDFIKKNNIKLNQEEDLVKLVNFLNTVK